MNDIPPPPAEPTNRQTLRKMVDFADQAVNYIDRRHGPLPQAAALAFYRSWQTLARHMLDDTVESENRRVAWDRVAVLESKLDQVRDIITDPSMDAYVTLRIREALDR